MSITQKILITFIAFTLFGFVLMNTVVFAQDNTGSTGYDWNATQQQIQNMAKDSPIKTPEQIFNILANILRYAYTIFFIVAILFILIAAFNFLTAKDNPEKVKSARSQILWAAVAIAVALLSVGAAQIIQEFIQTS